VTSNAVLSACGFFSFFSCPEDGIGMFLWGVFELSPDYADVTEVEWNFMRKI
jgi:hypothetical protein